MYISQSLCVSDREDRKAVVGPSSTVVGLGGPGVSRQAEARRAGARHLVPGPLAFAPRLSSYLIP